MYKWILLGHAIGAAIWFGGSVYIEGLMASASRTKDESTYMTTILRVINTNTRIFTGAGIITVLFGIWLVIDGGSEFEDLFVSLGFVLAIAAITLGLFLFKPRGEEIETLVEENGLTDSAALDKAKSLMTMGHVQTLLIAIAFIVMILQPGL